VREGNNELGLYPVTLALVGVEVCIMTMILIQS